MLCQVVDNTAIKVLFLYLNVLYVSLYGNHAMKIFLKISDSVGMDYENCLLSS